jgi:hypothetical protein
MGTLAVEDMRKWQLARLNVLLKMAPASRGPEDITIAVYHYWPDDIFDREFDYIEMSIRETWHHLGALKVVLIINHMTPRIERFCQEFPEWIKVDVCEELQPGNVYAMCRDAIGKLYQRIDTNYVMYVHPDGWALRSGIEPFMGQYDYIGAPFLSATDNWVTILLRLKLSMVGNGGFSLRSKELFEKGAWYYKRKYKLIPNCFLLYEDIYFTCVLPSYEKKYREQISIAPPEFAATFALEDNIELYQKYGGKPLGFHSWRAFARLVNDGHISMVGEGGRVQ